MATLKRPVSRKSSLQTNDSTKTSMKQTHKNKKPKSIPHGKKNLRPATEKTNRRALSRSSWSQILKEDFRPVTKALGIVGAFLTYCLALAYSLKFLLVSIAAISFTKFPVIKDAFIKHLPDILKIIGGIISEYLKNRK